MKTEKMHNQTSWIKTAIATTLVISAIVMAGVPVAEAQVLPVIVQGMVTYADGTHVPAGWTVNMENLDEDYEDEPWNGTTGDPGAAPWDYTVVGSSTAAVHNFYINVSDPTGVYFDETNFTATGFDTKTINLTVLAVGDHVAPTTEVTAPPEVTSPIPSGTPLNWTNRMVNLSFNRTDSGSGVNYTILSATPSVTVNINNVTAGLYANNTALDATGYLVNASFGQYFNVTIDEACSATIAYYSVDKNVTAQVEATKSVIVRIDKTLPSIVINTPTPGWYSTNITVNATVTDTDSGVNVSDVWFRWENATGTGSLVNMNRIGSTDNWSATFDITGVANGNYTIRVNATDNASNNGTENVTGYSIGIDTSPPTIVINLPTPGWYTANTEVNATVTDAGGSGVNVSDVKFRWENLSQAGPWVQMTRVGITDNWSATFNIAGVADGNYTIRVNATDTALTPNEGTKNVTGNYQIGIETKPPSIVINTPTPGWYSTNIEVNATVIDAGVGVNASDVWFRWENLSQAGPWVQMTRVGSTDNWGATFNIAGVADGNYTIRVNATDNVSNNGTATVTGNYQIGIDTSPPTIVINTPTSGWYSTNITVNATVTDAGGSGVNVSDVWFRWENATGNGSLVNMNRIGSTNFWSATFDITQVVDGNYTIRVNATDTALTPNNGTANVTGYSIGIDTSPPTIVINLPIPKWYTANTEVNATVTDAGGSGVNVSDVKFRWENLSQVGSWMPMTRVGSTNFWSATFDITGVADGNYTIRVNATDTALTPNEGTANVTDYQIGIETKPPSIVINTPTPGWYSTNITVNATVIDAGVGVNASDVWFRWENPSQVGPLVQMTRVGSTNFWSATFDITGVADGNYTIRVNATDNVSNKGTATVTGYLIGIDTSPPTIVINTPTPGWYSTNITVNAAVTDASSGVNVSDVRFRWENATGNSSWVSMNRIGSTDNWSATFDITGVADGNYTIRVNATDTALTPNNGTANVTGYLIGIDTSPPTIVINTPTPGWYSTNITVNATVTDAGSGVNVSNVRFKWDGTWQAMSRIAGTDFWNATFDITGVAEGNYTIRVNATDNVTNANSSTVTDVAIDKTKPTFAITTTTNYTLYRTNLTINVSEQLQGGVPTVTITNESGLVTFNPLSWNYPTRTGYYTISTATSNYTITVNGTDLAGNTGQSVGHSNVTIVTFNAGVERSIPVTPPNMTVKITTTSDVPAAGITVTKMEEVNITAPAGNISAGIFVDVDAEESLRQNITWMNLTIYYNQSDIEARGIIEETLRIYYHNEATGAWERYDYPDGGINTAEDYVWANIRHLSGFAVMGAGGDISPPAAISDLTTSNPTSSSITLTWTAPGDDGMIGTAHAYDIRYSTSLITDANWATAIPASGEPAPLTAGTPETFTVSGLNPSTTYYFAIKTSDEVPNESPLSNVASGTTSAAAAAVPIGGGGAAAPAINVPVNPVTGAVRSTTTLTAGRGTLTILEGTIVRDANGNPLSTSIAALSVPTTAATVGAIAAYDFGPSGTTFSPPIDLVIAYDPAALAAGVSETDLVIRMWDGTTWIDLATTINTVTHTATAKVPHFTVFALFAAPPIAPPPTPTPMPVVTPTPPPVTPVPTPTPPFPVVPTVAIIAIVVVVIIAAVAYVVLRRKRK
jgi:hypothetical protein